MINWKKVFLYAACTLVMSSCASRSNLNRVKVLSKNLTEKVPGPSCDVSVKNLTFQEYVEMCRTSKVSDTQAMVLQRYDSAEINELLAVQPTELKGGINESSEIDAANTENNALEQLEAIKQYDSSSNAQLGSNYVLSKVMQAFPIDARYQLLQTNDTRTEFIVRNLRGFIVKGGRQWERLHVVVLLDKVGKHNKITLVTDAKISSGVGDYPNDSQFTRDIETDYSTEFYQFSNWLLNKF